MAEQWWDNLTSPLVSQSRLPLDGGTRLFKPFLHCLQYAKGTGCEVIR